MEVDCLVVVPQPERVRLNHQPARAVNSAEQFRVRHSLDFRMRDEEFFREPVNQVVVALKRLLDSEKDLEIPAVVPVQPLRLRPRVLVAPGVEADSFLPVKRARHRRVPAEEMVGHENPVVAEFFVYGDVLGPA